jgi:hypothetical protein
MALWLPGVFPTIGFRIITELSSPEELPHLEGNELSNNDPQSADIGGLASLKNRFF